MSPEVTMVARLLLAAVLGGVIGLERELTRKPAGMRTHMLICIGSTLFTLVSVYGFPGSLEVSRIAAGVVTGVGFIGAGAIIFRSNEGLIAGLTTASTIWIVAAVGLAVGTGLYIAAVVTTFLVLGILLIPRLK